MDIRTKLLELLTHDDCPLIYVFGENMNGLVNYLIANGVTFATDNDVGCKWIPVTERPPREEDANEFGEILVWLRSTKTDALWKWRRALDHPEAISHWMPLPEPPKEDA